MRALTGYALLAAAIGLGACRSAPAASASSSTSKGPELYGVGLFTTGAWNFCLALSPDQTRAMFCRADDGFTVYDLFETQRGADGHWSLPVKPRFASRWSNADVHLSADGNTALFISNRPLAGEGAVRNAHDLWLAERDERGDWRDARHLPAPVNLPNVETWGPSVAQNGNIYFGAERPGTRGGSDIWVARRVNGVYQEPENLGDAINTGAHEVDTFIARDESYLIFGGLNRADSAGGYDLYVSQKADGRWQKARPLAIINTAAYEFTPSVSPDGKWLYFSSNRRYTGRLGDRFDTPRDDGALAGIGDGKRGDTYRIAMRELGLDAPAPVPGR